MECQNVSKTNKNSNARMPEPRKREDAPEGKDEQANRAVIDPIANAHG